MKATKVVLLAASFGLAQCADWVNFKSVKYLFVFGDSYSTVGFRSTSPVPNPTNPIGLKYPGTTITKGENWAGVLTTKVNESLILTWDYAVSGQQVTGVVKQIGEQFIPTAGKRPSWCPWNATNSLFVTWIGINDINRGVNGARNFLFLNLPPFDRAPGAGYSQQVKGEIAKWNTALPTHIANFTATHKGATAFLYDTQVLWDEFYAKPDAFNITNPDTIKGGLWYDEYHPSTEIQRVIGQRVAKFLKSKSR
ncbi:carbohydrate esterase family 16 protein [Rhizoctonia solani]|uniref:Carbohydrate esterase family 16 protein n=1 Tax=Rhizoctonia solani TaxID=456999 RepID=A0A8H8SYB3_9AGAM|nr:carbohydrate esterase family 16 protein [Rhizoctonia solani]QRW21417.1 carbohydrate esterase family 16 protein [Rhizoctonia solani]